MDYRHLKYFMEVAEEKVSAKRRGIFIFPSPPSAA